MGEMITLTAEARTLRGKKARRLRKTGKVPGIVYGQGFEPILFEAAYPLVEKVALRAGKHTPISFVLDGKKKTALFKDIARHATSSRITHVALHAVRANDLVTAEIPVHLEGLGESPAEKAGLIILQAIESVEVRAKAADLPEALSVSVQALETHEDKLTLADIMLEKGVEFADVEIDLGLVIANVYEPSALQAANEAAAGDAEQGDEPEVPTSEPAEEVA